ncbi:hypothetical protein ACJX0J_012003, partial [Zea mays]
GFLPKKLSVLNWYAFAFNLLFIFINNILFDPNVLFLKIPLVIKSKQKLEKRLNLLIDCQCYMGKMKVIRNVHMSRTYFITIIQVLEGVLSKHNVGVLSKHNVGYFLGKMIKVMGGQFHHIYRGVDFLCYLSRNFGHVVVVISLSKFHHYKGVPVFSARRCCKSPWTRRARLRWWHGHLCYHRAIYVSGDLGWMRGKIGLLANAAIFIEKAIMLLD